MGEMSPADALRSASVLLRQRAAVMRVEIDSSDYWKHPGCCPDSVFGHDEAYSHGVQDGLGGASGDFAARFTPGFADLLADSWDAMADEMEEGGAVLVPGGVGEAYQAKGIGRVLAKEPDPTWTTAYRLAVACLAANEGGGVHA